MTFWDFNGNTRCLPGFLIRAVLEFPVVIAAVAILLSSLSLLLGCFSSNFLKSYPSHTQFKSHPRIHRFWTLSFSEFPPFPPNFLLLKQSQTLPVSPQPCRTTTAFFLTHALHRLMISLWKKAIETWIVSHLLLILKSHPVSACFC